MISESLAAGLLTATLTSLWTGSLLAVGVVLAIKSLPMGAQARYRLWSLALAATVIAPLIRPFTFQPDASSGPSTLDSSSASVAPEPASKTQRLESLTGSEESPLPSRAPASSSVIQPVETFSLDSSLGMAVLLVWGAGAIAGLAWLALQILRLGAFKRAGSPPGPSLRLIWSEVVAGNSSRRVRLLLSQRPCLPAACGYFHPAIVAPAILFQALTEEETRHLLMHELAHLSRYDDWRLLAHRLIQAILWWHPVVWFINRRLDAERELACDEMVVEDTSRRDYARTLVRVAEMTSNTTMELAPGVLRGDLSRRIESLLQMTAGPARLGVRARAGAAAASVLALAVWIAPPTVRFGGETAPALAQRGDLGPVIARRLDSILTSYVDSGFSGSILLAIGGEIVLAEGYGMADRERGIPATAETRYSVAGFTKMFTAAAVLTLEDERRLSVNDSLTRFFGRLPGTDGEVTLHQLLTHTDGLTRQNAPVYRSDREAFIRAVSATPDTFAPGQGYRYNDFGHSVLGVVIEQVSGTSYETFIRNRFLRPAGLAATGFESERGAPYAIEYGGPPGRQYPIPPRSYTWGRRASLGMVSTVGDMYRWVQTMRDPRVLSPGVRDRMLEPHGPTDWGTERGYGWDRVRRRDGSVLWRRVAGTPGMEGEILQDPVQGWTAVILINSRVEWRFRVWDDITEALKRGGAGGLAR
jgi:CubicO group peptidase (beta-lactamase class C family)/beta-lactamase regulating signal transducer with metallopeptidase domain